MDEERENYVQNTDCAVEASSVEKASSSSTSDVDSASVLSLAFTHTQVAPNVYLVVESYYVSWNQANIWVVQGSDRDLVIDAGLGIFNVAKYLEQCGLINPSQKTVLAVATHVHFDHSGGLRHFSDAAIHDAEADALINGDNRESVTFLSDDEISLKPVREWRANQYRVQPTQVSHKLSDGDMLNLGDRCLRVVHLPGLTPGSIALLDDGSDRFLFSGDVVYDAGSLMLSMIEWLPQGNATAYVASARHLESFARSGSVAKVFPGHGDSFGSEKWLQMAVDYQHSANGLGSKLTRGIMKAASLVYLKYKQRAF